jgi:hypothetical protein
MFYKNKWLLLDLYGARSQNTAFFIVTAVEIVKSQMVMTFRKTIRNPNTVAALSILIEWLKIPKTAIKNGNISIFKTLKC